LAKFDPVFKTHVKNRSGTSRLIGAALLLFVFFLPFHVHFTAQVQVTKECSCLHGTRTGLAPAVNVATSTPVFQTEVAVVGETLGRAAERFNLCDARGPPSSLSL
jgi:hypothetical protein